MSQTSHEPLPMSFNPADEHRNARVLVIAELGVNHQGDPEVGRRLIAEAAAAGADAIKLQLFKAEALLSNQAVFAAYQKGCGDSPVEMLRALELQPDAMRMLAEQAHRHGLGCMVTPFSLADVEALAALPIDAVKIASPDAVNKPLLQAAGRLGLPMFISTGACMLEEVRSAAGMLGRHEAGGALLHCISQYPTPTAGAQLGAIAVMRRRFGLPVGYSDHTTALHTGALAVAAGACVIEKHLTLNRDDPGPDHAASLDPEQMCVYIRQVREAQAALGQMCKTPQPGEADVRHVSRQSVCATRDLPVGTRLRAEDLTFKRPGDGVPARFLDELIGRTLTRPVTANDLLQWDDLASTSRAASDSDSNTRSLGISAPSTPEWRQLPSAAA